MNDYASTNRRRRRRLLVLCSGALCLGCGIYGGWVFLHPEPGGELWRAAQADAVREAVLRKQIADHRYHGEVCFITVSANRAANNAFARRFAGAPFVKPLLDTDVNTPRSPMLMNGKSSWATPMPPRANLRFTSGSISSTGTRIRRRRSAAAAQTPD